MGFREIGKCCRADEIAVVVGALRMMMMMMLRSSRSARPPLGQPPGQKKNLLGRVVGPSEAKVWPGIFSHMTFRGADLLSCPCRHGMFAELISLLVSQACTR